MTPIAGFMTRAGTAVTEPSRGPCLMAVLRMAGLRPTRQRLALAELTDEQLDDIGLTRRDVERECRPFWKP
jgi:uncharacterized protein YjiS (DUF1127 family)